MQSRLKLGLLTLILGVLLGACGDGAGSSDSKVYNVGIHIDAVSQIFNTRLDGLKDGMKGLGFVEGKNLNYFVVNTTGMTPEQEAQELAAFAAKNYNVYWVAATATVDKLLKYVTTKPVIAASMPGATLSGLIKSNENPGGNFTGVDNPTIQLSLQRLDLLKELNPNIRAVYLLYIGNKIEVNYLPQMREHAKILGIKLIENEIKSAAEGSQLVAKFSANEAQAIITMGGAAFSYIAKDIKEVVLREKLLVGGADRGNLDLGSIFSYGANNYEIGKQSTEYVIKVLYGANPATLPLLYPNKIEFVLNQKIADQIGFKIPASVIAKADEVVK